MASRKKEDYPVPARKSREGLPPSALKGQGSPACICPVCKNVFSTVNNYELHRKIIDNKNYVRICVDPDTVGLKLGANKTWIIAQDWYDEEEE